MTNDGPSLAPVRMSTQTDTVAAIQSAAGVAIATIRIPLGPAIDGGKEALERLSKTPRRGDPAFDAAYGELADLIHQMGVFDGEMAKAGGRFAALDKPDAGPRTP